MTLAVSMILIGSLLILGLAGYWMVRVVHAGTKLRIARREKEFLDRWNEELIRRANTAEIRLGRIISLETPNMAHVGKKAVAIAKGEL